MSDGDYLVGLAFFVVIAGASVATGELAVRRRMGELRGSTRLVAVATLATAALLIAHLLPGALTILSRETAAGAALLLLVAASRLPAAAAMPAAASGPPEPSIASGRVDRLVGTFGVAVGAVWIVLVALRRLHEAPQGFDAAHAYLPTAARWLQEGSIWGIADWLPGFFFGASPGNGSVVVLAGMLPWDNDFVARYAIYPFVVLLAVALYALARELGAPRTAAALIGLMVTAAPVIVQPALQDALLDPVLYFGFAAGLLFLIRHHRTGQSSDLLVAGVALGIAFGTKFYGFTSVPIVIAVWAGARLIARVPRATVARQAGAVVGLVAAFGGIWVLRNLIETGNPIFPVELELLGTTIFSAPPDPFRESLGSTLFEYLDDPRVWTDELAHQFRIATGVPLLLLGGSVLGAFALLIRRRRRVTDDRTDGVVWAAIVAVALLALAYALTPYSAVGPPGEPIIAAANVRYAIPVMIAAVAVAGFVAGRIGHLGLLAFEVLALLGMLDAIRVGTTVPTDSLYTAIALAALGLGLAMLLRRLPRPTLPRSVQLSAVAVLALLLGVIGPLRWQQTYNDGRYTGDEALRTLRAAVGDGASIGLAGSWTDRGVAPTYPAFGVRLQNRVSYVGPTEDGLLGTFPDRSGFLAALDRSDHDALVVGCVGCAADAGDAATANPPELRWARSRGYEERARSDRLILLVRGEGPD